MVTIDCMVIFPQARVFLLSILFDRQKFRQVPQQKYFLNRICICRAVVKANSTFLFFCLYCNKPLPTCQLTAT